MKPFVLGSVLAAVVGLVTWNGVLRHQVKALESDVQFEQAKNSACSTRISNIMKDRQSDATVTNPGTYDAPNSWFLP